MPSRCLYTKGKAGQTGGLSYGTSTLPSKVSILLEQKSETGLAVPDPWHHGHQRPPTEAIDYNEVWCPWCNLLDTANPKRNRKMGSVDVTLHVWGCANKNQCARSFVLMGNKPLPDTSMSLPIEKTWLNGACMCMERLGGIVVRPNECLAWSETSHHCSHSCPIDVTLTSHWHSVIVQD